MTWREATVVRILLLVARIISGNPVAGQEIQHLSNHISCGYKEAE